jgi:hypothetical protein
MGIDGSISSGSGQVLILTVWDVEVSFWVTVFLCETKINDIDLVATFSNAHQEIVWLDITVDEGFGVDVFDAGNQLIGEEENSLEGEFSVAEVEQVLQAGS